MIKAPFPSGETSKILAPHKAIVQQNVNEHITCSALSLCCPFLFYGFPPAWHVHVDGVCPSRVDYNKIKSLIRSLAPCLKCRKVRYVFLMALTSIEKQWQQLPNGLIIQEQVQQAVTPWLRSFVGEHLLKFGALSAAIDSQSCPVKRHFSGYDDGEVDIRFVPECLPIQSHSIDVGLMSFVLDFEVIV